MSKINISFDNKNYSIDSSAVAQATGALKQHLLSQMNGDGATITLDGVDYNVDTTKLSEAKDDFITKLSTLQGEGAKVTINGVEYSIDSIKIADALSNVHAAVTCFYYGGKLPASEGLDVMLHANGICHISGIGSVTNGNVVPAKTYIDENGNTHDITHIYQQAFYGNNSIMRVEIPENIVDIGFAAFDSCENLRTVYFHGNCRAALSLGCFNKCTALEEVIIPASITVVDDSIFRECTNLKRAILYGTIGTKMFYGCSNLEEVYIGDTVTEVADNAFHGCSVLRSIRLGDSVNTIGADAFRRCLNLGRIIIPANVTSIDGSAFLGCTGLLEVEVDAENSSYKAVYGNLYTNDGTILKQYAIGKTDTHFAIPEGVATIGNYAFHSCVNITHVTVPKSVTVIGSNSFRNCENIQMIDFSSHEAVPTLKNAYAFGGTPRTPFIVVPDALYDEWVTTGEWSAIADTGRIVKASEVTQ